MLPHEAYAALGALKIVTNPTASYDDQYIEAQKVLNSHPLWAMKIFRAAMRYSQKNKITIQDVNHEWLEAEFGPRREIVKKVVRP